MILTVPAGIGIVNAQITIQKINMHKKDTEFLIRIFTGSVWPIIYENDSYYLDFEMTLRVLNDRFQWNNPPQALVFSKFDKSSIENPQIEKQVIYIVYQRIQAFFNLHKHRLYEVSREHYIEEQNRIREHVTKLQEKIEQLESELVSLQDDQVIFHDSYPDQPEEIYSSSVIQLIERINEYHHYAINLTDMGIMARQNGSREEAKDYFSRALEAEMQAAASVPLDQPQTRAMLYRSAAYLALDCNDRELAVTMMQMAVDSNPSGMLMSEMNDIKIAPIAPGK